MNPETGKQAIARAVEKAGLDAAILMSPKNVWALTGYPRALSRAQRPGSERAAVVIAYPDAEPTLVVGHFQVATARATCWTKDIAAFRDYATSAFLKVVDVLEERGLASGTIGVEQRFIVEGDMCDLVAACPGATFSDLGDVIDAVRSMADNARIAAVELGLEKLDTALQVAFETADPAWTRLDLHNRIMREILQQGSDSGRGGIGSVADQVVPLESTQRIPLVGGELLRLEYTCDFAGTTVRNCTMAAIGALPPPVREDYDRYLEGLDAAVASLEAYMPLSAASRRVRTAFRSVGLECTERVLGHGLAPGFIDYPVLTEDTAGRLEPGHVVSLAPLADTGVRVSRTLQIEESGVRVLDPNFPIDKPIKYSVLGKGKP